MKPSQFGAGAAADEGGETWSCGCGGGGRGRRGRRAVGADRFLDGSDDLRLKIDLILKKMCSRLRDPTYWL